MLSELDEEELLDFCGITGSTLGTIGSSLGSDFLDEELDEDFLLFGESTEGFGNGCSFGESGFLISSLSELDLGSSGTFGFKGSTVGSEVFFLLEELLDELLLFLALSFFLLELEELDESLDLTFSMS